MYVSRFRHLAANGLYKAHNMWANTTRMFAIVFTWLSQWLHRSFEVIIRHVYSCSVDLSYSTTQFSYSLPVAWPRHPANITITEYQCPVSLLYSLRCVQCIQQTVVWYYWDITKCCRYTLSGPTWIGPEGDVTCTLLLACRALREKLRREEGQRSRPQPCVYWIKWWWMIVTTPTWYGLASTFSCTS